MAAARHGGQCVAHRRANGAAGAAGMRGAAQPCGGGRGQRAGGASHCAAANAAVARKVLIKVICRE